MRLKQEVYEYIKQLYSKKPSIEFNFRTFIHSVEARLRAETFPIDWKSSVRVIVGF